MFRLLVNVDEAVDDMVRQIKGVSGGLKKKAVGSGFESSASFANRNVSFKADELTDSGTKLTTSNSFAQNKGGGPAANVPSTSGLKEDPFGVPAEVILVISIIYYFLHISNLKLQIFNKMIQIYVK